MTAGLLSLSAGGGTSEPPLIGYILARRINQAAGGTVVAPWEVGQLPDEWIDAATAIIEELPGMQDARAKVAERIRAWREKHPGYRQKHG